MLYAFGEYRKVNYIEEGKEYECKRGLGIQTITKSQRR